MPRSLLRAVTNGPAVLAFGVITGLLLPPLADVVRPFLPVTVVLFVLGTFLRVDVDVFRRTLVRPWVSMVLPLVIMVGLPSLVWVALWFVGFRGELLLAIALATASPPSSGNAAMARMLGYEGEIPITIILVAMLMAPFSIPLSAQLLGGADIETDVLLKNLFSIIISTSVLAVLVRSFFESSVNQAAKMIDNIVLFSLFVFAVATMAGVHDTIIYSPIVAIKFVIIAYLTNIIMHLTGFLMIKGGLEERIATGLTFGNRNVGLVWAAVAPSISPTVAFYFAASQLPIFTIPWFLRVIKSYWERMPTRSRSEAKEDSRGCLE